MSEYPLKVINETCYIKPRPPRLPDGAVLTYHTCPDVYDNQTHKLIFYCCLELIDIHLRGSFYQKTQDWLHYYSSTMLVGPAVLFNLLSLAVLVKFQSKNVHKTSTTFYMKCLCVFDMLTILSKFLNEVIVVRNALRGQHPLRLNDVLCKSLSFAESLCAISSIYLLIAMTVDKLICVLLPLKVSQLLTPNKARIVFACLFTFSTTISSYNLVVKEAYPHAKKPLVGHLVDNGSQEETNMYPYDCKTKSEYSDYEISWTLFDNVIRVFIPFIMLCICNSWIAVALAKASRRTEELFRDSVRGVGRANSLGSLNTNGPNYVTTNQPSPQFKRSIKSNQTKSELFPPLGSGCKSEQALYEIRRGSAALSIHKNSVNTIGNRSVISKARSQTNYHISIMLLTVSIGFIVFNLPFAVRTLFHRYFSDRLAIINELYQEVSVFHIKVTKRDIGFSFKYEFYTSLAHLLLDLNYIANFFLYFFSGSKFRSQLFDMFMCRESKKGYNPQNSAIYRLATNSTRLVGNQGKMGAGIVAGGNRRASNLPAIEVSVDKNKRRSILTVTEFDQTDQCYQTDSNRV